MDGISKIKIRVNGREYASPDQMPARVREAYLRAIGETAILRSGARLASKLNAKIIINGMEFNNPGEMPVVERRLYQDTLAALVPNKVVTSSKDAARARQKRALLMLLIVCALATVAYFCWRGFAG